MKIIRWSMMGLMMMAPLVFGGTLAHAFTLPAHSVPSTQINITPKHVNPKIVPKKRLPSKGSQPVIQGCPKLVAQELHIVRAVAQPGHPGEYRFILDGTILNKGSAGVASFGMNAYQKTPGGAKKRIALKLFKKNVRRNQRLSINRDLHMTVQSDPISGAKSSLPSFTLSVLNLRNDQGQCSEYNPTVATVNSAKFKQASLVQPHGGVAQQVETLKRNGARRALLAPKPLFGRGAPVTRRDGKSLIPPKTGPLHTLGGGTPATPHGGSDLQGNRLTSVTPVSVAPGGTVTVQGQFRPGFRRYGYLTLYPARGGQGKHLTINSSSTTTLTATVPGSVASGNYSLRVDMQGGGLISIIQQSNALPVTVSRLITLPGGFAPQPSFGRGAPVTGLGGASLLPPPAPQMKLTLKEAYRVNNRSDNLSVYIVGRGDRVRVVFEISNLGTATGSVKVGKIGRPLFITDEVSTVAPGQTVHVQLEFPVTHGNTYMGTWSQVFRLMTTTNQEYRDSHQADNYVTATLSFDNWSGDIAVKKIFGGTVTMNPYTAGFDRIPWLRQAWKGTGSSIPESYTLKVTVSNRDIKTSSPRQLTVMLKGLTESNPLRGDRHFPESNSKMINCSGSGCPLSVTLTVPALRSGEARDIPVTFNNLGYRLWVENKARGGIHRIRASGYYKCADTVPPSLASIQITVRLDTHGDAVPANNGLRQSFQVGAWRGSSCQVYRLSDASAFIP